MLLGIFQLTTNQIVLDFGIHLFVKSFHVFDVLPFVDVVDGVGLLIPCLGGDASPSIRPH